MKKKIALFACILFILGSISTVYADENSTAAGSCSFTGKEMVSSFDSNKLAVSVSEMQPGDEVTFSVNIKNDSDISTKWYMSNDVLSSLEDALESAWLLKDCEIVEYINLKSEWREPPEWLKQIVQAGLT